SETLTGLSDHVPNNANLAGDWSNLLSEGKVSNLCGAGGPSNLNFNSEQVFMPSVGTPFVCPAGSADAGKAVTVKQPYPNNQLPTSAYNPVAVNIMKNIPRTNAANNLLYVPAVPLAISTPQFTIRADYDPTSKQQISGHVFYENYNQPLQTADYDWLAASYPNGSSNVSSYVNYQGSWLYSVSSNVVNNLIVAAISPENTVDLPAVENSSGEHVNLTDLGATGIVSPPPSADFPATFQDFEIPGWISNIGGDSNVINRRSESVTDSVSWSKGNNLIVAGLDMLHYNWTEEANFNMGGEAKFTGGTTGVAMTDVMLGTIDTFEQGGGEFNRTATTSWALFGQDTIRLKPNLSVDAGLRWEPYLPPTVNDGRSAAFRPGEKSTVFPNAPEGLVFPGDRGITGTDGILSDFSQFAPRLGLAWQPKFLRNTSIRAAFGIFYLPFENRGYHHMGDTAPFSPSFTLAYPGNGVISLTNPWASSPGTGFASPFPPFSSLSYVPPSDSVFDLPVEIQDSFSPNFALGKTQSWNLSVEHQFSQNMMLTAAYVGNESYDLPLYVELNPGIYAAGGKRTLYPNFSPILQSDSEGTSSYNALQLSFEKRLSHGLQVQTNYTWSKCLDTASARDVGFGSPIDDPFDPAWNFGPCDMNFPQDWVTNFVWETPSLQGHSELIQRVFGSWQPAGIFTMESGPPFSISAGCNGSNESLSGTDQDRADLTGQLLDLRQGSEGHWLSGYFNTGAFECNVPGTFGDSMRNLMQGPPLVNLDMGIDKEFPMGERYRLELRWEMFNSLNTPHFGFPGTNPSSPGFGTITGLATGSTPREMQLAAKFYW
ncbi:MAG: hypothetical protein ACRD19_12825, partial [Terriglobia bacterium]